MATKQITIERFIVISAKTFAEVASAIAAQVGHPDIKQFYEAIQAAEDDQELQRVVNDAIGPSDLMEFMRFDQGAVLRHELGPGAPNIMRLLIGNPLTMRKMARHVHDAGSYAPVTVLIDERADGVHLSYDRMASLSHLMGIRRLWKLPELWIVKLKFSCCQPHNDCRNITRRRINE